MLLRSLAALLLTSLAVAQDTDPEGGCGLFEFECPDSSCISLNAMCAGTLSCPGDTNREIASAACGNLLCVGSYPATNTWCDDNCNHNPPNCPISFCNCAVGSRPAADSTGVVPNTAQGERVLCTATFPATNEWCDSNCNHDPPFCPLSACNCAYGSRPTASESTATSSTTTRPCKGVAPVTDSFCTQVCNYLDGSVCPTGWCLCDDAQQTQYQSHSSLVDDEWCTYNCNLGFCPSALCAET